MGCDQQIAERFGRARLAIARARRELCRGELDCVDEMLDIAREELLFARELIEADSNSHRG